MVRDLDFPLRIKGVPTMREPDGLAMSSRNVKLTPQDRAAAPVLYRALRHGSELAAGGATAAAIVAGVRGMIAAEPRADIQSVDLRDTDSLRPVRGRLKRPAVILLAVRFGAVLLIDNKVVEVP
jgi:pantoate--beta-alanine ligase